ncbi:hypothetical protein PRJ39_16740 [Lysobacter enzymogenes]|uniref:alginate O-acetyltransferase AlgX-related protein n=1 Tax=Lysobacter enzymogenes TaxID=69 RepID=UPI00374A181F
MSYNAESAGPLRSASRLKLRSALQFAFCAAIFAASLVPAVLTLRKQPPDVEKVQELRKLAEFPGAWEGGALAVDKNYVAVDRWFNDNLAYRSLMIRLKNQLDYSLFRSSSRVYFGKRREIYGRNLLDNELPAAERLFATDEAIEKTRNGVAAFDQRARAQGVTVIWIAPLQRAHFDQSRLPFFAPRLPQPSRFFEFYSRLKQTPQLQFVDLYALMRANQSKFPLFFRQDFHWTDLSARLVAMDVVERIAKLEGSPKQWAYPLAVEETPYVGSDMRFAALLHAKPLVEPGVKKDWADLHVYTARSTAETGLEFDTDSLPGKGLLPTTCLFGNSFSDGMVRVGLGDHFESFTRFDRNGSVLQAPETARARGCKYLIIQLLDISPAWSVFAS